jgi:hypothetical protein
MAMSGTVQYLGLTFVQWVNPLGLAAGGWKYYFLFFGLLTAYCAAIYWLFPETKGLSLEEVGLIFSKGDDGASAKHNDVTDAESGMLKESEPKTSVVVVDEDDEKDRGSGGVLSC